jgi:2-polyprenyl-3-methyl-5-hydroxy-6-metoxy-1,4-benzoquinol methylase
MRSDRKVIDCDLEKYVCQHCGLVHGRGFSNSHKLEGFYSDEYVVSEQFSEYFFYTPDGQCSRSSLFCEWVLSAMGEHRWNQASRCLEVGAGSGLLLQEFRRRFPEKSFEGIELNKAAVARAQEQGLPVHRGEPRNLDAERYDIIYSVAVLEHVASPTEFIRALRRSLRAKGLVFLCQPTQDVPSYDLFFSDHLYHFGTEHLRAYARKTGFRELGLVVGHQWMPNYSLHLWTASEPANGFTWRGSPGFTTCEETARDVLADMARLDKLLAQLSKHHRRVAVFGLNEVYWLASAYSDLGDFPVVCGLEDNPEKAEYATLPFPVIRPEQCLALNVQDVILTMNKVYYDQIQQRLTPLGVSIHPVLS